MKSVKNEKLAGQNFAQFEAFALKTAQKAKIKGGDGTQANNGGLTEIIIAG